MEINVRVIRLCRKNNRKSIEFLLNELKDLSWLEADETLKEFPIRTSVAMQMENAIIDGILSRCGAVSICSNKATSAPYTQKNIWQISNVLYGHQHVLVKL